MVFLITLCLLAAILLGGSYYAYRIAFYSPKKGRGLIPSTSGPQYDPYRADMSRIFKQLNDRPFEQVTIFSLDGLKLSGRYYHVSDSAVLDIGFHGYRSHPLTDFSGGSELSFQLGHNLLLVDQRAHGDSEGRTISFGIQERQDVYSWVQYAIERFGPETKLFLHGISMGAATVLMASDYEFPENVRGIIADCPYSVALDIILHVGKEMPIPQWLMRPFVILGAKIYGGFDIRETDANRAVKNTSIPILLIHGEADHFVPCEMSVTVRQANPELVSRHTFPNASHGMSYLSDTPRYQKLVSEFVEKNL